MMRKFLNPPETDNGVCGEGNGARAGGGGGRVGVELILQVSSAVGRNLAVFDFRELFFQVVDPIDAFPGHRSRYQSAPTLQSRAL